MSTKDALSTKDTLKKREKWHEFFQAAEVDICNLDTYQVVCTKGPVIVPNHLEKPLLILTPEQLDLWNKVKPWEPTKTVDSDT